MAKKEIQLLVAEQSKRFPNDFVLTITAKEPENLRNQIGASSWYDREN